jgi:multidrug resistance efflux pump
MAQEQSIPTNLKTQTPVKAGTVLFEIERSPYKNKVKQP